jgi:hypothetical protein
MPVGQEGITIDQTDAAVSTNGALHDVGALRRAGKVSICGKQMTVCQDQWDDATRALASRYDLVRR